MYYRHYTCCSDQNSINSRSFPFSCEKARRKVFNSMHGSNDFGFSQTSLSSLCVAHHTHRFQFFLSFRGCFCMHTLVLQTRLFRYILHRTIEQFGVFLFLSLVLQLLIFNVHIWYCLYVQHYACYGTTLKIRSSQEHCF